MEEGLPERVIVFRGELVVVSDASFERLECGGLYRGGWQLRPGFRCWR